MQRVSAGYTIVEVMIFLAVSATLLAAGMNLISGKQAQTAFNQTMRETQSAIQGWISNVSNGFPGGDPTQLNCIIRSGLPLVKTGGPSSSPQCEFLGKAIQFTDKTNSASQSNKIYEYPIFGARLDSSGQLPTNLKDSQPAPIVSSLGGVDLTGVYDLGSAQVTSVTSSAVGSSYTASHLIGFFSSFNTEQSTTTNGSQDLNAYQFRFDGSSPAPGGAALVSCLELTSVTCYPAGTNPAQWPEKLQSLKVCFSDGVRTAQLTISSSYGVGYSTKLDYISC